MTLFAVGIIFLRHAWNLTFNITTIEGWEFERHESLVRRAKKQGGYLDGPDGIRVKMTQQEFPYDICIFGNIAHLRAQVAFILTIKPHTINPL